MDTPAQRVDNPFNLSLSLCHHSYDEATDIHIIRFPSTQEAVTEFLMIFEVLNQRQPPSGLNRLLTETEGRVIPPMSQIFRRAREFKHLYPEQAPYRLAIMLNQYNVLMNLIEGFVRILRSPDILRSFDDEQAALDWLRTTT